MVGKEAVKLFPNDPTPYFNLANVMGKADRYKESEQYFLKAIQLSGNSPVAKMYANLGKEICIYNQANTERIKMWRFFIHFLYLNKENFICYYLQQCQ